MPFRAGGRSRAQRVTKIDTGVKIVPDSGHIICYKDNDGNTIAEAHACIVQVANKKLDEN